MGNSTLATNAAIETRKQLVGIAKLTGAKSIASAITSMASRTTTAKAVSKTKKASFLIPFLVGVKKLEDVLAEARNGGVKTTRVPLAERTVVLANELVTDPVQYVPEDGTYLEAPQLLQQYQEGFSITATAAKDINFFETVWTQGKAGAQTGEKSKIISTAAAATAQDRTDLLDEAIDSIFEFKDGVFQKEFEEDDLVIVISTKFHRAIKNVAKYNLNSGDRANSAFSNGKIPSGIYDGIKVLRTKNFPANVEFMVLVGGAAVQQFLFKDKMNKDKQSGVDAYTLTLQFKEGTVAWFPQLIVFGSSVAANAQDAVGMGTAPTFNIMEQSSVEGTDPSANPAPAPSVPSNQAPASPASPANIAFDATTFKGDVMTLPTADRSTLKVLLKLAPNSSNKDLQVLIDKR